MLALCLTWIYIDDEVAEWLRRWTANPMGSARVGSNPILVGYILKCNKIPLFLFENKLRPSTRKILSLDTRSKFTLVKKSSVTGNRTRATWVRARYPNH